MRRRFLTPRLLAAALAGLLVSVLPMLPASPASAAGTNLALGKTATASSFTQTYAPSNVNDGNQATYWESNNNAFPQWAQVDLGSATQINQVVLKLPSGWGTRTETLSVQGSTDNSSFSTIVASTGYTFDGGANTVTINFTTPTTRYVRMNVTANTGLARRPALRARDLRPGRQRSWHQPRARQDDVGERRLADVRGEQRQRRQPGDLLGEHEQRVPAVAAGRPRLVGQRQQGRAEAADRLGRAHRDAVGAGQHGRRQLHHLVASDGYTFDPARRTR